VSRVGFLEAFAGSGALQGLVMMPSHSGTLQPALGIAERMRARLSLSRSTAGIRAAQAAQSSRWHRDHQGQSSSSGRTPQARPSSWEEGCGAALLEPAKNAPTTVRH